MIGLVCFCSALFWYCGITESADPKIGKKRCWHVTPLSSFPLLAYPLSIRLLLSSSPLLSPLPLFLPSVGGERNPPGTEVDILTDTCFPPFATSAPTFFPENIEKCMMSVCSVSCVSCQVSPIIVAKFSERKEKSRKKEQWKMGQGSEEPNKTAEISTTFLFVIFSTYLI